MIYEVTVSHTYRVTIDPPIPPGRAEGSAMEKVLVIVEPWPKHGTDPDVSYLFSGYHATRIQEPTERARMKQARYRLLQPDGTTKEVDLEYDPMAPCINCGLTVVNASVGGTAVCCWCDIGVDRNGTRLEFHLGDDPIYESYRAKRRSYLEANPDRETKVVEP